MRMDLVRSLAYEANDDAADLWLNFAKLVIGFLVVYESILLAQEIPPLIPYHVLDGTPPQQVVTASNPLTIRFAPVVQTHEAVTDLEYFVTIRYDKPNPVNRFNAYYCVTFRGIRAAQAEMFSNDACTADAPLRLIKKAERVGSGRLWEAKFTDKELFPIQNNSEARQVAQPAPIVKYNWPEAARPPVVQVQFAEPRNLGVFTITRGDIASYTGDLLKKMSEFRNLPAGIDAGIDPQTRAGRFKASAQARLGLNTLEGTFIVRTANGRQEERETFKLDLIVQEARSEVISVCGGGDADAIKLIFPQAEYKSDGWAIDLTGCLINRYKTKPLPVNANRDNQEIFGHYVFQPDVTNIQGVVAQDGYSAKSIEGHWYLLLNLPKVNDKAPDQADLTLTVSGRPKPFNVSIRAVDTVLTR